MPRPQIVVCAGQDLFASFFARTQRAKLSKISRWTLDDAREMSQLREDFQAAEALVTTWDSPKFPIEVLRIAPKIRMIAHCGGEVKSRFAPELFDRLTITNSAEPMAKATAEMGAALLAYSARNIDMYRDAMRLPSNRIYEALHLHGNSESLIGREVAMIGFGRIGRALIDLMRGFNLQWVVHDPYASKTLAKSYPVRFVPLPALLKRANLLVLTAALTKETQGMLNRERLARLPDGAVVINIARGGLVDLAALTQEVKKKRLRCAFDVTDPMEPLPVKHPLRKMPGAIVTPHIAASNLRVREQIADVVIDDLQTFFAGRGVKNRVTRAMLERMT